MIARSLAIVTLFGLTPLLYGGCEPPPVPVVNAPPPPPAPPVSAEIGTDAAPSVESAGSVAPFAGGLVSQPPQQNSPPSAPTKQPPIHLSAGVALPQSLPE